MSHETKEAAPPRIRHNSELAAWFMLQHKVTGRYPRVIDQLPALALEHKKLFDGGYNPGMAEFEGKVYLSYRWHDGNTLHSSLAIAETDLSGVIHHNRKIELGTGGEDPKLFIHNDQLHISWIESTFPAVPWRSSVQYGHFEGELLKGITRPEVPGNDATTIQKNHVPWSQDGSLFWIYQTSPVQQVYRLEGSAASQPLETPGPKWAYGQPRGGIPPLPFEGHLLRFFHSGLDNEFGANRRRYFLGAYLMRAQPPFEVLATSSRPICYGSETDAIKVRERPTHWKPNVVFPGGAVAVDGGWLVSVGVNDSACEILKITAKDLHLT